LAGCGIGSVIAECALRLGFENITITEGDNVELSHLNRQNHIDKNIGTLPILCGQGRIQIFCIYRGVQQQSPAIKTAEL
jgi:tRNA A37 threonylcarbamoyladenosine dehydratase